MSFYYLSQPYWHLDELVREQRYQAANYVMSSLIRLNKAVYAPIVHNHLGALRYPLPTSHEFWLGLDYQIASRADGLIELRLHGWEKSIGMTTERKWFYDRPIHLIEPLGLTQEDLAQAIEVMYKNLHTFPLYSFDKGLR